MTELGNVRTIHSQTNTISTISSTIILGFSVVGQVHRLNFRP